ncbi:MAG: helix-turn-helix transcriptional regulator [Oscillospiraceae bacterium]|nr:helix-turn-helix transcriptional regulator [Oscillospiraceae bacterium]
MDKMKTSFVRIRDLREDNDLKQRELAEILFCSQRVYSNYERGELDIPTEVLIKLAKFYNTSVDYILGLTDKKEPYK